MLSTQCKLCCRNEVTATFEMILNCTSWFSNVVFNKTIHLRFFKLWCDSYWTLGEYGLQLNYLFIFLDVLIFYIFPLHQLVNYIALFGEIKSCVLCLDTYLYGHNFIWYLRKKKVNTSLCQIKEYWKHTHGGIDYMPVFQSFNPGLLNFKFISRSNFIFKLKSVCNSFP